VVCNDNNDCTADSCDPASGCTYTAVTDGSTCSVNNAAGTCTAGVCLATPVCNGVKSVTIRGGGQKPNTVDLQIETECIVVGDGCIVDYTASTITVSPGTVLQCNYNAGHGPDPSSGTWQGVPIATDSIQTIECPNASGDVGKLILDNKVAGGKDTDRITIKVQ